MTTDTCTAIEGFLELGFHLQSMLRLCNKNKWDKLVSRTGLGFFNFFYLQFQLQLQLQCLDGESSSGESPVPQIRWIGQFLLSRLFSSLNSSVLRSGFSWAPSLVWCLLHFWWMTSCTYDMPRSACRVALETYHSASTIIRV
jgi:hypothetical protein